MRGVRDWVGLSNPCSPMYPMSASFKSSLFFLWAGVIIGALDIVCRGWGPFPIPRWRDFGTSPIDKVILSLSFFAAVWLSFAGWHTKDRLKYSAWAIAALSFVALLDFAFVLSMPLAWSVWDVRAATGSPRPALEPTGALVVAFLIAAILILGTYL